MASSSTHLDQLRVFGVNFKSKTHLLEAVGDNACVSWLVAHNVASLGVAVQFICVLEQRAGSQGSQVSWLGAKHNKNPEHLTKASSKFIKEPHAECWNYLFSWQQKRRDAYGL